MQFHGCAKHFLGFDDSLRINGYSNGNFIAVGVLPPVQLQLGTANADRRGEKFGQWKVQVQMRMEING